MNSIVRLSCVINRVSIADPAGCLDEIKKILPELPESDITVLPKLALCPPSGGSLVPQLRAECAAALDEFSALCADRAGYMIVGLAVNDLGRTASAVAVLCGGELVALIPTLDNTEPFLNGDYSEQLMPPDTVFSCGGLRFSVLACRPDTLAVQAGHVLQNGCDLVIVPAYTPIHAGLIDEIEAGARATSAAAGCAVAIVNGGVGDTSSPQLYKGFSMVYECGELLARQLAGYQSAFSTVDLNIDIIQAQKKISGSATPAYDIELFSPKTELMRQLRRNPFLPELDAEKYLAELFDLQVRSLASRMENIGVKRLVIGVSGGIDSTAALMVCAGAMDIMGLPRENVLAVSMPGLGTSDKTRTNADRLMAALGVESRIIPITEAVKQHFADISHDGRHDTAYENAQARERTQILMDLANMCGGFVVGTGDLSEAALGFSTFGGDQLASFNVNICITKTVLRELLAFLGGHNVLKGVGAVLRDILDTPISPELLPPTEQGEIKQRTEEILGPYELHDFFLYYFLRYKLRPSSILFYACAAFAGEYEQDFICDKLEIFLRRFCAGQFKRSCAPDCAAINEVNLCGVSFQMPSDMSAKMLLRDIGR